MEVQYDANNQPFYINENGQKFIVSGGQWVPAPPEPAAVPVAPMPMAPAAPAPPTVQAAPVADINAIMSAAVPVASGNGSVDGLYANLSTVDDASFRLIPAGTEVVAVINKASVEKSGSSGDNMIKLELSVVEPAEYKGVKIWDQVVLTEKSLWKYKRLCRVCNLLSPDGSRFVGSGVESFKGNNIAFKVIEEEYNQRQYNKVAGNYEFPSSGVASPQASAPATVAIPAGVPSAVPQAPVAAAAPPSWPVAPAAVMPADPAMPTMPAAPVAPAVPVAPAPAMPAVPMPVMPAVPGVPG